MWKIRQKNPSIRTALGAKRCAQGTIVRSSRYRSLNGCYGFGTTDRCIYGNVVSLNSANMVKNALMPAALKLIVYETSIDFFHHGWR